MTFTAPFGPVFYPVFGAVEAAAAAPEILDEMTDTNGVALSAHAITPTNTVGASWSYATGAWQILSNKAKCTSAPNPEPGSVPYVDFGYANHTVSLSINGSPATTVYVIARYVDDSNFWLAQFQAGGFYLIERTGGGYTVRDSDAGAGPINAYYTLTFVCSGTSLSATTSTGLSVSYTSSQHQSATKCGTRDGPTAADITFDDFHVVLTP